MTGSNIMVINVIYRLVLILMFAQCIVWIKRSSIFIAQCETANTVWTVLLRIHSVTVCLSSNKRVHERQIWIFRSISSDQMGVSVFIHGNCLPFM